MVAYRKIASFQGVAEFREYLAASHPRQKSEGFAHLLAILNTQLQNATPEWRAKLLSVLDQAVLETLLGDEDV